MDEKNLVELIHENISKKCKLSTKRKIKEAIIQKPCLFEKYIRSDGKKVTRTCKTNPIINEISEDLANLICNSFFKQ